MVHAKQTPKCIARPTTISALSLHTEKIHTKYNLVHLSDELVDVVFSVTEVTALDEVLELAYPPATSGVGELERPKEVRRL